jgi:hypothetical protein
MIESFPDYFLSFMDNQKSLPSSTTFSASSPRPPKNVIGRAGKGSCRIRLSSERDSKGFTNDKFVSSRTTLFTGHKEIVVMRPPHPGYQLDRNQSSNKQQVTP